MPRDLNYQATLLSYYNPICCLRTALEYLNVSTTFSQVTSHQMTLLLLYFTPKNKTSLAFWSLPKHF